MAGRTGMALASRARLADGDASTGSARTANGKINSASAESATSKVLKEIGHAWNVFATTIESPFLLTAPLSIRHGKLSRHRVKSFLSAKARRFSSANLNCIRCQNQPQNSDMRITLTGVFIAALCS